MRGITCWSTILLRTGSLVLLLVLGFSPVHGARDVAPQRECATCHIAWLTDFKRQDVTPLIAYEPKPVTESGREDVASTSRMCFSCHDGFMIESRATWTDVRHQHPVGVKPSAKVTLPTSNGKTLFPLNDDGKVYCGTCHTAHGVDWEQSQSPVFMRMKNVDSSLCLACHRDRANGPAEGNHPTLRPMASPPEALRSAGAKFGRQGKVICQTCHRPHGAAADKMLVKSNSDSQLCAECHTDKQAILNTKHDLSIMAPEARNRRGESLAESGPCGACHVPHGGKGPALWAREPMPGAEPGASSCLSCHHPDGLAKEKGIGERSHPLNVALSTLGIGVKDNTWLSQAPGMGKDKSLVPLPLYDARGHRDPNADRVACGTCHDPHRWSPAKSTAPAGDPRRTEGGPKDSFLRLALDDNSGLCVNCHINQRPVAASKHNIPAFLSASGEKKKPAAESGLCQSCHQVHNARGAYLWTRQGGSGKGLVESLCTDCHRLDGMASKHVTGEHSHPVATRLRPGMRANLPLFAAADGQGARENLDCATCHDPHRWDPSAANHKADTDLAVEGNARTSFLRLVAAPDGDLCTECHREQGFVRRTDHDMAVSAPRTTNAKEATVKHSGVCGQCHAAHNAGQTLRLWARVPGPGENATTQLCTSCHAAGQPGEKKTPLEMKHPSNVLVWNNSQRSRFDSRANSAFPVFNTDGKDSLRGNITCLTCHDPHRWEAGVAQPGPGKNSEGDVRTSFLRATNSEHSVCAYCHGLDSLYRYKYFHGKSTHVKTPPAR